MSDEGVAEAATPLRKIVRMMKRGAAGSRVLGLALVAACVAPNRTEALAFDTDPLAVPPGVRARLASEPYAYFRFENVPFANLACTALRPLGEASPRVHLHGDAHLEQYAVTETSAGLTDFDDAAYGPAHLDLVRFGSSIYLAAHQKNLPDATADALFDDFLRAYWSGVAGGSVPEPQLVARFREGAYAFAKLRIPRIASHLKPVAPSRAESIRAALAPYLQDLVREQPSLPPRFFEIVEVFALQMGIGSARHDKFVARLRGASASPEDDEFMELKEVSDLSGISCLDPTANAGCQRILRSQATLAMPPERFLASVIVAGESYSVRLWPRFYRSFDVNEASELDLREIAASAGAQLGAGHARSAPEADWSRLKASSAQLKRGSRQLTRATLDAWERLRGDRPQITLTTGQR